MKDHPVVALIIETSNIYGRRILQGITDYLHTTQPWSLFLDESELHTVPPAWLSQWRGDGILCRSTTPQLAAVLRRRGIPVVDMNDYNENMGLPRVASDMAALGRLGAEHLLDRGFRHFAFCGYSNQLWVQQRQLGFSETLAAAGFSVSTYLSPWRGLRAYPWERERDRIAAWLKTLPRPVGILACNDVRGRHVVDACRHVGIAVPEEIAVVGVDNDDVLCLLADPPLSSIVPDCRRIGFAAAEMLDSLMAGKRPSARPLIQPRGIVVRQSSDVLAIEDRDLSIALRFIRENACHGIKVSQVARQARLSRPVLERRFRHYLKRSPQAEIRLTQIKRIRELLTETDLPLKRIAELAGFQHAEYMHVMFRRMTGQTPGEYRQEFALRNKTQ